MPLRQSVRVRAFAKINLHLKVLGRRADGYHELRAVYQTIALADRLQVEYSSHFHGINLQCDAPQISAGPDNLVYQAVAAWKRAVHFRHGVRIKLAKRIPMGAGLGGGSSDAAAVILALEHLTGDRLSLSERLSLGMALGSDVPLFFLGGRVLGCGRGEEVYPLADLPARRCLVVFPGFSLSTQEVFGWLGMRLTETRGRRRMGKFGARPQFLLTKWGPAENDFESVVFARWPELAKLKRQFIRAGAETALLTGTGSALYAVFDSAEQLLSACRHIPPGWKFFRTRTLPRAGYWRRLLEGHRLPGTF